ncbi:MAG: Gfo/Idh/MocA family oxidoreductase [Planctomycetes bacterium]|nr:Gfo/Idh/MocA family oxidoreductase [Planctomycetota bacterium]
MEKASRREFLRRTGGAAAIALGARHAGAGEASGAAERVVLGIIGPGGMGMSLLRSFASRKDVAIAHVCDVDEKRMAAARDAAGGGGKRPEASKDLRRVLDDRAVDAVVIATPDHWHGPATILALAAGKHVYVEKPASHNLSEGRLMVDAARKAGKVVQVGTQSRSTPHVRRAVELIRDGAIGDVLVAKAWNSQLRANIGHAEPSDPPAHLDFDLWVGPAPMVPYRSNLLHSSWRWFRAFGCGDMGNDGVHDIDIARWGLGAAVHPTSVAALGGKYFFDDDQEFPDTQYVVFEYGDIGGKRRQLVFEQRIWSPYVQEGHENGDAFYGTKGMLILGKGSGWKLFGPRNELREEVKGGIDSAAHHADFLDAIRTGRRPHADIEEGHLSAALVHLGNIATRLGRTLRFDPAAERFTGDGEADAMLAREYRPDHWAVPKG